MHIVQEFMHVICRAMRLVISILALCLKSSPYSQPSLTSLTSPPSSPQRVSQTPPLFSSRFRSTLHTVQKAVLTMLCTEAVTQECVQAIRPVYNTSPVQNAPITATDQGVVHVTIQLDPEGRKIVLWEDVQFALKGAINIRHGTKILSFLRGSDYQAYVACLNVLIVSEFHFSCSGIKWLMTKLLTTQTILSAP
jgi:hypothetical protein